MTTHDFHEPIFLWVDRNNPGKGARRLDSVEDAVAALFRADISAHSTDTDGRDRPAWTAVLHHLSIARANGCRESLLLAHRAMLQLVTSLGIIAGHVTGLCPDTSYCKIGDADDPA
jgi:hypothetical protein